MTQTGGPLSDGFKIYKMLTVERTLERVYSVLLDHAAVYAKWSIEKKCGVPRHLTLESVLIVSPRGVLHVFNVLLSWLCKWIVFVLQRKSVLVLRSMLKTIKRQLIRAGPISPTQRAHDVIITSLLRQNDVATLSRYNNGVIIASCARLTYLWRHVTSLKYSLMSRFRPSIC